jgi:protein-L-isoaspartate(D-aspartate) O-methyltransferase
VLPNGERHGGALLAVPGDHPSLRTRVPGDADRLRTGLVSCIRGHGTFRTAAVEEAFAARLPRHLFLPSVPVSDAYAPKVVITKRGCDGRLRPSWRAP